MLMAPPQESPQVAPYGGYAGGTDWEQQQQGQEQQQQQQHAVASRDTTLFLIDWDDTVLSSSWLAAQGLRLDSPSIPDEVAKALRELEEWSMRLLRGAMALGKVALVTNAERGWIELSARKFIPSVVPLLEEVVILSARTTFQDQFPGKTQMWKNAAYEQIYADFASRVKGVPLDRHNVLSLGDSLYERTALKHLAAKVPGLLTKSVKLIERPDISQLQRQLEIICSNLEALVANPSEIDLMLTVEIMDEC